MGWEKAEKKYLEAYEKFADGIFRHTYLRLGDREKAKDLTQETFLKVWQYLIGGKSVGNFKAFLYKVASNLIIDETRKKKTDSLDKMQEESGFDPIGEDTPDLLGKIEFRWAVEKIKALGEDNQDILLYRYIDDLPIKQIAEIVGESENVISVRLHRAMKRLKQIIEEKRNV